MAEDHGYLCSFIEAPEDRKFVDSLYPKVQQVLRKLSLVESAKAGSYSAMRTLRSFAAAFKISMGDVSVSVDPEEGSGDSGILEFDLPDLFERIGLAAKAAGKGWILLIDEVQYLSKVELSALIVAIHHSNQKNLPILFLGAGLPQVAALSGDAKSYAERLFDYPPVGPLDDVFAEIAIRGPVSSENEAIEDDAVREIIHRTEGYPFFLQEWGYQAWNIACHSPIKKQDILDATPLALNRLDDSFFRVRFDRLTPKQREYVFAMASLGKGPYRSSDVAESMGKEMQKLGTFRKDIIQKGMIYSPAYGDIAFTVPMFEDFLNRLKQRG